jgi:lipopolysaccharide/colanic/teichoic acid biosynthesis glycosyltransferase
MKYQYQNLSHRIRKNEFKGSSYLTNSHSMSYSLPHNFYRIIQVGLINRYVYEQISLLLSKKDKSCKELIINKVGFEAYSYIEQFVNIQSQKTLLLFTARKKITTKDVYQDVISLQGFNSINRLDSFLCKVNENLEHNGKFIGFVQTNKQRKENQWFKGVPVLGKVSTIGEFIFHRVCPKIIGLKQVYFGLTQGKYQRLSKAEVLGRLIKFGFKIEDIKENLDGKMYFTVKKIKRPDLTSQASNGILYKFPRVGQNGKLIGVYKIRTMHPYSEYLQDYIVNTNGYGINGKPANDFRVPAWSKFVRRYWLDEIPQLINVFKGEMKLFGVRPVTERYFQDIPKHIQKLRLAHKPGCIPAYVAYNKASSKNSVLAAEERYLNLEGHGVLLDLKFIFMAVKNIIFNKKRGA